LCHFSFPIFFTFLALVFVRSLFCSMPSFFSCPCSFPALVFLGPRLTKLFFKTAYYLKTLQRCRHFTFLLFI
jgi:hypothetical protein